MQIFLQSRIQEIKKDVRLCWQKDKYKKDPEAKLFQGLFISRYRVREKIIFRKNRPDFLLTNRNILSIIK